MFFFVSWNPDRLGSRKTTLHVWASQQSQLEHADDFVWLENISETRFGNFYLYRRVFVFVPPAPALSNIAAIFVFSHHWRVVQAIVFPIIFFWFFSILQTLLGEILWMVQKSCTSWYGSLSHYFQGFIHPNGGPPPNKNTTDPGSCPKDLTSLRLNELRSQVGFPWPWGCGGRG